MKQLQQLLDKRSSLWTEFDELKQLFWESCNFSDLSDWYEHIQDLYTVINKTQDLIDFHSDLRSYHSSLDDEYLCQEMETECEINVHYSTICTVYNLSKLKPESKIWQQPAMQPKTFKLCITKSMISDICLTNRDLDESNICVKSEQLFDTSLNEIDCDVKDEQFFDKVECLEKLKSSPLTGNSESQQTCAFECVNTDIEIKLNENSDFALSETCECHHTKSMVNDFTIPNSIISSEFTCNNQNSSPEHFDESLDFRSRSELERRCIDYCLESDMTSLNVNNSTRNIDSEFLLITENIVLNQQDLLKSKQKHYYHGKNSKSKQRYLLLDKKSPYSEHKEKIICSSFQQSDIRCEHVKYPFRAKLQTLKRAKVFVKRFPNLYPVVKWTMTCPAVISHEGSKFLSDYVSFHSEIDYGPWQIEQFVNIL